MAKTQNHVHGHAHGIDSMFWTELRLNKYPQIFGGDYHGSDRVNRPDRPYIPLQTLLSHAH